MPVEYRNIPGFPGYRVGDDGSVWSHVDVWGRSFAAAREAMNCRASGKDLWRVIAQRVDRNGYRDVTIVSPSGKRTMLVHGLVMLSFVGATPDGLEILHCDDKRGNNCLRNLRFGTHSENIEASVRAGTHNAAKLDPDKVREIRSRSKSGEPAVSLARAFGVGQGTMSALLNGHTWRHVA